MVKIEHNQKIGFEFSKNRRRFDEFRQQRHLDAQAKIKEITFVEASEQLITLDEIDKVFTAIGGGKEATVILAQESITKDLICAKVFRYFTGTIRKRLRGTKHISTSGMASIVAKQEYWNLVELYKAQIPVPKPRYLFNNIVIMDFINSKDNLYQPAPLLSEINISNFGDPEDILYESIAILAKMFIKAKYVHGDYSDHNLMITENGLVTMDVSQSVIYNEKTFANTPVRIRIDRAVDLLRTDLYNLNNSFKKYRISVDPDAVCQEIIEDLPEKLQELIKKSKRIYPVSQNTIERLFAKEEFRAQSFSKRTRKKYQKRKW